MGHRAMQPVVTIEGTDVASSGRGCLRLQTRNWTVPLDIGDKAVHQGTGSRNHKSRAPPWLGVPTRDNGPGALTNEHSGGAGGGRIKVALYVNNYTVCN